MALNPIGTNDCHVLRVKPLAVALQLAEQFVDNVCAFAGASSRRAALIETMRAVLRRRVTAKGRRGSVGALVRLLRLRSSARRRLGKKEQKRLEAQDIVGA